MERGRLLAPSTLAAVGACALVAGAIACGSQDSAFERGADSTTADGGNGSSGGKFDGDGSTSDGGPPTDANPVDGVILVHASYNLPAARVCFDDREELRPLPDDKLMPRSNLIGLDVGTAVRLPSLHRGDSPTRLTMVVYAESAVRAAGPTVTCHDLDPKKNLALVENKNFWRVPIAAAPFVDRGITVIALEGCVGDGSPTLDAAHCGVTFNTPSTSTLRATTHHLDAPTGDGVRARALVLSDALRASKNTPTLTYGDLQDSKTRRSFTWDTTSPLSKPLQLEVPAREDVYEAYGFVGSATGGGLQQSLALTQELSDPAELPRALYAGPSTLAVFLLGDPALDAKVDPSRGFHAVTVPVRGDGGGSGSR